MPRRKPDPAGWLRPLGLGTNSYGANILAYFWSILVEHHARLRSRQSTAATSGRHILNRADAELDCSQPGRHEK